MSSVAIATKNLEKMFRLYAAPADRLKEALSPLRRKYHQDFYALRDVNICVEQGQCVGIIGLNGSGKSTLLQLIAGVLTPTGGTVEVHGKIAALLELGAGFNPEFTGRENIVFQCSIMGYKRAQIDQMTPSIIEYADIGDFINHPVKTYSSGMYVRLAFAVAINVNPDILIVDEALAVGDIRFQSKCMAKIREFRRAGKSMLFVSHDPGAVKSLCDKAYLLDRGRVVDEGDPDKVFNFYNSLVAERDSSAANIAENQKIALRHRSGNGRIRIESVKLLDNQGCQLDTFVIGAPSRIEIEAQVNEDTENPTFGILLRDRLGNDIFGINNHHMSQETGLLKANTRVKIAYDMPLDLGAGIYNVSVAAHAGEAHVEENFDWINDALVFRVILTPERKFAGVSALKPTFSIKQM
jgi:lipopolysaccharide transport system ATP-binding protein